MLLVPSCAMERRCRCWRSSSRTTQLRAHPGHSTGGTRSARCWHAWPRPAARGGDRHSQAALVAAFLNLVAAAGAVALEGRIAGQDTAVAVPPRVRLRSGAWRVLVAAFLSGGILLRSSRLVPLPAGLHAREARGRLPCVLAVVLFGIATGVLVASSCRLAPDAPAGRRSRRWLRGRVVWSYATFVEVAPRRPRHAAHDARRLLRDLAALMFHVSFLSACCSRCWGGRCTRRVANATRATGLVTLANTTGAMLGASRPDSCCCPCSESSARCSDGLRYGVVALLLPRRGGARAAAHPARSRGAAAHRGRAVPVRPDAEPLRAADRLALAERGVSARSRSRKA
jgi:hypothetical protein